MKQQVLLKFSFYTLGVVKDFINKFIIDFMIISYLKKYNRSIDYFYVD